MALNFRILNLLRSSSFIAQTFRLPTESRMPYLRGLGSLWKEFAPLSRLLSCHPLHLPGVAGFFINGKTSAETESILMQIEHAKPQTEKLNFRFSGAPDKIERFFSTLAEMEIPCDIDRAWGTFSIPRCDSAMTKALASILLIRLFPF